MGVTYSIIQVTRLFTEVIWSMTMIALQNTAQQLMNDYTGQQRDNTHLSNKYYQYLWIKLTTSQKQFFSAFSTLYSCQMAFNTLNALFMGYNWLLPLGLVYHMLTTDNVDSQLSYMAYFSFLILTYVYILMGSTTADLAQRAMEKETKEKLLKIIGMNKQKQLPCNQEHLFLKNVTQTDTGIELGYYDKIDRNFFIKVLFASANTTTLITQFQSIIASNEIEY
ncbi:uncharacterized protein LOC120352436 [Nilaparvata lugens]|uniref:uncharacterized protein LOC120352436 n=1 Tax=Nilaparvata lugens TaxID=108931 RepID=UPI00193D736D|nr:uncharacterized protein LOC120352436 [Nilaparvata lugens]XP_039288834.1 uncharacterized protein LOC120352436 [Nilaparvata lugens]XP_039288835.1 uncharacterized protein LOC120352436 [Nilaparvata lugens]XP_039288836.1 uncharacterized protein LOC120352436 [Nilaparvata lugens]